MDSDTQSARGAVLSEMVWRCLLRHRHHMHCLSFHMKVLPQFSILTHTGETLTLDRTLLRFLVTLSYF